MFGELTNHLWQSTLFAVAAAALTLSFRNNRAEVRYWIWFSVSVKFLLPFSLLMSLGSSFEWAPLSENVTTPTIARAVEQFAQPFSDTRYAVTPIPNPPDWKPTAIIAVWTLGLTAIAWLRIRSWRNIRRAVHASSPVNIFAKVEVRSVSGIPEPSVVGFLHPILLLPEDIQTRLTQTQLNAVLAHELCHIRRRDNLLSLIHMIIEGAFWFHPIVWWVGARLIDEREQACDEEVLRLGSEPRDYAEAILSVCKFYVETPLACISGIMGADLKKRIEAILSKPTTVRLNSVKRAVLAAAGGVALALPIALGVVQSPMVRAQSSPAGKFAVRSIKSCRSDSDFSRVSSFPGRFDLNCVTLQDFIKLAYVVYANGHYNVFYSSTPIEGGPLWTNSERYTIDAIADNNATRDDMNGPMLQALLEDRFKLKIRRETREVPAYSLTVAKNGPRLQRWQEGSCTPVDLTRGLQVPRAEVQPPYCRNSVLMKGSVISLDVGAATADEFSRALSIPLHRPVVNNTGLVGKFKFLLEFLRDDTPPGDTSILTAIQQQLGLNLKSSRGTREYLVIDHVEKPSND